MKIFCTEYPLLLGQKTVLTPEIGRIFLRGDSAINNSGKVLSRPWWCETLASVPLLVVRIGKVGRAFDADQAERYYSEVALGVGFADPEYFGDALKGGCDPTLAYNFDGSLFLSSFYSRNSFPKSLRFVSLRGDERKEGVLSIDVSEKVVGETLSLLSRYYLMKMGDLVTFPLLESFEPVVGDERRLYEGADEEVVLDLGVRVFRSNFTSL